MDPLKAVGPDNDCLFGDRFVVLVHSGDVCAGCGWPMKNMVNSAESPYSVLLMCRFSSPDHFLPSRVDLCSWKNNNTTNDYTYQISVILFLKTVTFSHCWKLSHTISLQYLNKQKVQTSIIVLDMINKPISRIFHYK